MTPTAEQGAIHQAVRAGEGSVMVEAGAGCGKTSTLAEASKGVKTPALAIAFNKRIQQELADRLPGSFVCKTMNGLGHAAWGRAIGKPLKLDDRKAGKLVSEVAKGRRVGLSGDQWDACRGLLREAQVQGLVPKGFGHGPVQDSRESWRELADEQGLSDDDFDLTWELAREALEADIKLAFQGTVSFDDQIYCPTLLGSAFPKFPVVFVDEDQDLNPLQILMVEKVLAGAGRLLAVGDRHQSIYAFRGAVGEAAQQLKALRPTWTDLPLMTSFRVPQVVAERQKAHVPLFRAWGANPVGQVHQLPEGWTWPEAVNRLPSPELAVLCRNNAPLLSLAFKLIRGGVGVRMLGRDLGKGLTVLSKKLAPSDEIPAERVAIAIEAWMTTEISKAEANDKPALADRVSDQGESLLAVLQGTGCKDAGQLRRQIERLFAREDGLVTLSSIHKAKGLEWTSVLHLDPWRLPSKQAKRAGGRVLEQEWNLRYVCETRTKHTLLLGNLADFAGTGGGEN